MKTDLGLDLKRNLWYELRIKQEQEDLGRRVQHAATVGRRIASLIPPGLVVWMEVSRHQGFEAIGAQTPSSSMKNM